VSRPENARSYPSLNQPFNRNQGIINLLIYPLTIMPLYQISPSFKNWKKKKLEGLNLSAIVKNKNLPMLKRRHGASISIQVRICNTSDYQKLIVIMHPNQNTNMHKNYDREPILMEVTRRPQALRTTPMLLAVTPLPSPLTTPPVTRTYFISLCWLWVGW